MTRPKLPKSQRLTAVTFVRMRKDERRRLDRRSKRERKSRSAILRAGFLLYEEQAAHFDILTAAAQARVPERGRK